MSYSERFKLENNENPVCPFCESTIEIEEFELYQLYVDDIHYIDCPYCKKEIRVISNATYTFSTDEQE